MAACVVGCVGLAALVACRSTPASVQSHEASTVVEGAGSPSALPAAHGSAPATAPRAFVDSGQDGGPLATLQARLPAVTRDRSTVAALVTRDCGARGEVNTAMLVIDVASDQVRDEYSLEGPSPPDARVHSGGSVAALAFLSSREWTRLQDFEVAEDVAAPLHDYAIQKRANLARQGDAVFTYREPELELRVKGRTAVKKRVKSWSAKGNPDCPPYASIATSSGDLAVGIGVFEIDYHTLPSDNCWTPTDTVHVVAWRPVPAR
jgi:hypothetical protein